MLPREAEWFGAVLSVCADAELFPFLHVGSQSEHFRCRVQPWIEQAIFAPLRRRGGPIVHLDLYPAPGVDLVGDICDPRLLQELERTRWQAIMCCNVLEHVGAPRSLAEHLLRLLAPGGLLFVSCPYRFPWHPDPIDNGLRPDVQELAAFFPGTDMVHGARVAGGTLTGYLLARGWSCAPVAGGASHAQPGKSVPTYSERVKHLLGSLPWLVRQFWVSCLVVRKR
ncbi:MAG: methyltransferase type 11 [Gemmataceae bacterium]